MKFISYLSSKITAFKYNLEGQQGEELKELL